MTPVERPSSETSRSQTSSDVEHWLAGDDLTHHSNETGRSTWQEEAHWMSFRHAVQKFALRKSATDPIPEEEERGSDEDESSSGNHPSLQRNESSVLSVRTDDSPLSLLASDLAETRMRLALAQAERDELEFALLQKQPSETGSR